MLQQGDADVRGYGSDSNGEAREKWRLPARTAVDLFSGCGGASLGLAAAEVKVVAGVELDRDAAASYKELVGLSPIVANIRDVSATDLGVNAGDDVTTVVGCPPCQSFSELRRGRGRTSADDERDLLPSEYLRLVGAIRPRTIAFENVVGFRSAPQFALLMKSLVVLGYQVAWAIVDAADFGIPQHRRRLIVVGDRERQPRLPEPTHGRGRLGTTPFATVRDAIAHLPPLRSGQHSAGDPMHRSRRHADIVLRRLQSIPIGGSRHAIPPDLRPACHRRHDGHNDAYGRMNWDRPAPTLTTGCTNVSRGRFGHPEQHRAITAREALLLQGFPEGVVLQGVAGSVERQIGNAVPPGLITAVMETLLLGHGIRSDG